MPRIASSFKRKDSSLHSLPALYFPWLEITVGSLFTNWISMNYEQYYYCTELLLS